MSMYQDMRRAAVVAADSVKDVNNDFDLWRLAIAGVIYALLAIAAAISDLKP